MSDEACPATTPTGTLPPPPAVRVASGCDVSEFQGTIDWPRVAGAGIEFAIIKATEGHTIVDRCCHANWRGARAAGLRVGAYHFFRPGPPEAVRAQIEHFLGIYRHDDDALPPALDLEIEAPGIGQQVLVWLRAVEAALDVKPMLYVSPSFCVEQHMEELPELAEFPLWLADWAGQPKVPAPWTRWQVWQTGKGHVDGIAGDADLDRMIVGKE